MKEYIDYNNTNFFANVSTKDDLVVYYLGQFEEDPDVKETRYHNGLDLVRIAACSECHTPYNGMQLDYQYTGDDLVRIFYNHYENATIQDFIKRFFDLNDGDMYISSINNGVYVEGRL
ncbi:MAG: hypothetical protein IKL73_05560 [Lachnospiraceae bacterium]|nr:hypothetical protein [Lachnospira sp.]MBR6697719.1 hypothetical protein [Lachnospiraceae bacterium]